MPERRLPHRQLTALGVYGALAAATGFPLLAGLAVGVSGGPPAWRALWGIWWAHDSLSRGASPLACDALRWPARVPLWLADYDLPGTLAAVPLWFSTPLLPEVALHNLLVLASYALVGFATYTLCRELWGGELAPLLSGALAVTATHAVEFAEPSALVWPPLFFLALVRTLRRRGAAAPLFAGTALALTLWSSHPLFIASLGGAAVLILSHLKSGGIVGPLSLIRRAGLLLVTFFLFSGWVFLGVVRAAHSGPWLASEDARRSVDALSFIAPGRSSAIGSWSPVILHGQLNSPDLYVGYLLLALAAAAAAVAKGARPWLLMACLGFVFALGPALSVHGHVMLEGVLPYAMLERVLPSLAGAPWRYGWLIGMGLAVAAGGTLSALVRAGRRGAILACAFAALALAETWPLTDPVSSYPAPRFLRDLARDPERWTVLDATGPGRSSWHQILHGHPQVGGDLSPIPLELDRLLTEAPVLRSFFAEGPLPPPAVAVRVLQDLHVRFVIVDDRKLKLARTLGVPLAFEGVGIAVFEVPPKTS